MRMREEESGEEEDFQALAANFLDMVFGTMPESHLYRKKTLKKRLLDKYGPQVLSTDEQAPDADLFAVAAVPTSLLLERLESMQFLSFSSRQRAWFLRGKMLSSRGFSLPRVAWPTHTHSLNDQLTHTHVSIHPSFHPSTYSPLHSSTHSPTHSLTDTLAEYSPSTYPPLAPDALGRSLPHSLDKH